MKWLDNGDLLVNPEEEEPRNRIFLRQVGWLGQTGAFYKKDEITSDNEPGGFSPIYIQFTQ